MASFVLDASAVLALIDGEPGADVVAAHINDAVLASANAAEVVAKLVRDGAAPGQATAIVAGLPCPTVAVEAAVGWRAGELYSATASAGLSLGDRICLALAETLRATALTADRAWRGLPLAATVRLIR